MSTPARLLRTVLGPGARDVARQVRLRVPLSVARAAEAGLRAARRRPQTPAPDRPSVPDTPTKLWVAPANFAGQGHQWARCVQDHVSGVGSRSMAVRGALQFPVDYEVPPALYRSLVWQREQEQYLRQYTHVLIEAERPVLGTLYGRRCDGEIPALRRAGAQVALISHGSDLRVPSVHAPDHPFSPFRPERTEHAQLTATLEDRTTANLRIFTEFDGPTFVSTPDLLRFAPHAVWVPGITHIDEWTCDTPVLERDTPVVVHAPSNGPLKGTGFIDPILSQMHGEGLIEYVTLRGLTHQEVKARYQAADIVVDQVVLGLYGVAAVEAMAAGRVVVGYLGDAVRETVREQFGLDVPVVEATPATLRAVMDDILTRREHYRQLAATGPLFGRRIHDGRESAARLAPFVAP